MSAGSTNAVCHMRPGAAMARVLGITHPDRATLQFGHALDLVCIVDGLKVMIGDAIKACRREDTRLDTKDVAHFVMTRMGALQAPIQGLADIKAQVDDANNIMAFAALLTEAIETGQRPDGSLDLSEVAAHVFAAIRSHRK